MLYNDILKAIPIGFSLAFMIGPVFFILIHTSIVNGARAAIVFDLGVILGDVVFILLAYYGSHQILEKIKDDPRLFFLGGILLFVYGLGMVVKKKSGRVLEGEDLLIPEKSNYFGLFFKGFFVNFINVGVLAFWLVMIVSFGANLDMDPGRVFNFFAAIIISYFITDLGKIILAKQLKRKLTPLVIYKIKRGMGIVIMIFGIALAIKGFIPKEQLNIDNVMEHVE